MSGSEDSATEWQFVKEIADNDQSSVDDSQSDGSIEVVSLETDILELEESVLESTALVNPPKPYFILRVPSSEQDFTTESESSDDSDSVSNKSGSKFRLISPRKTAVARTAPLDDSLLPSSDSASVMPSLSTESSKVSLDISETSSPAVLALAEKFGEQNTKEDIKIEKEVRYDDINSVHDFEIVPHVELEEQNMNLYEDEEGGVVEAEIPDVLLEEDNEENYYEEGNQEQYEAANVPVIDDNNNDDVDNNDDIIEENEEENFIIVDDTESSVEMEDEDDRIESDQSTVQHSDDQSNISNMDIGDLMADPNLIRQYVHRPNSHLNVTLNMVVILVIAVAIGLGIGHAIGSKRERFMQRRMWQDNFKSFVPSALTDQLHDRIEVLSRKEKILMKDVMSLQSELKKSENIKHENNRLHAKVLNLKEKYNAAMDQDHMHLEKSDEEKLKMEAELKKYENEIEEIKSNLSQAKEKQQNYENELKKMKNLKSEFERTKHMLTVRVNEMEHAITELKSVHERELVEKERKLKNIINTLEMEKQDLTHEIGSLRYTLHPGNDADMDQVSYKARLNLLETEKSDLIQQVGSMRYSSYQNNKGTTSARRNEQMDWREEEEQMKISLEELKEKLVMEEERSEMWQNLYLASQKENKRTRTDNSSRDFFGCVTYLLKNVTVPQNFSKMLKEKVDLSLDALKYIYKVWKGESHDDNTADGPEQRNERKNQTSREKRKNKKYSTKGGKEKERRQQDSWKETVEKVLNNTRSSMSDVSKQIHDTWQQVKNLSKDLWEKHQPTLENLQKDVSRKIDLMTAHIQQQLKRSSPCMLSKNCGNKWEPRHEKQQKRYDMDDKKMYSRKEMKYRAKTSRRGDSRNNKQFEKSHNIPKFNAKENGKNGSSNKEHKRKLKYLKKLVAKMKKKWFCEMDFQDRESVFGSFKDAHTHIISLTLSESDNLWYSCQLNWWRIAVNHLYGADIFPAHCKQRVQEWQWDMIYHSMWVCHDKRKSNRIKRDKWRKYHKQPIKRDLHYNQGQYKHHHSEKAAKHLHKMNRPFDEHTSMKANTDLHKSNLTSFLDCDPFDEKCNTGSWYIQKMHHRDVQRKAEEKAMWLLSRGKAREEYRQKEDKEELKAAWQFKYAKGRKTFRDAKPWKNKQKHQGFRNNNMHEEKFSETRFSCVDF